MVKAQQPVEARVGQGVDPAEAERLAAEEATRSSVFFRRSGDGAAAKREAVPEKSMPASAVEVSGVTARQQPFNPLDAMNPAVDSPADPCNGAEQPEPQGSVQRRTSHSFPVHAQSAPIDDDDGISAPSTNHQWSTLSHRVGDWTSSWRWSFYRPITSDSDRASIDLPAGVDPHRPGARWLIGDASRLGD